MMQAAQLLLLLLRCQNACHITVFECRGASTFELSCRMYEARYLPENRAPHKQIRLRQDAPGTVSEVLQEGLL